MPFVTETVPSEDPPFEEDASAARTGKRYFLDGTLASAASDSGWLRSFVPKGRASNTGETNVG